MNIYQFYCLLHVSALVKRHHQAIKNTERKIIKYNPLKIILFHTVEISTLQKLEFYKHKLDKSQSYILKYNERILY
jgi:hypothetical protein